MIIIIYTVKENLWKHTPMIKPYYRLITITGPGLKVSKKKKDYKNNIFIIIEMYISNGIDIMKKKYLYYFLINWVWWWLWMNAVQMLDTC